MRDGRRISRRFSVPLSLVLSAFTAFSQSTTSLRGTVSDPSAAVIPQAMVTLQDPATRFKRQILTGADGVYQFLQVTPGTYQLVVAKPGFSTLTRNVVELLSLQPGVTPSGEVLGARRDQNNIMLDGADVNNNQNSGLVQQNP